MTLTKALLAVHDVLEAGAIAHALCGGLAANLYREEVRATMDVDFACSVGPARLLDIVEQLEGAGWTAEAYWRNGEQLRLSHATLPRVDCILATTDFEHAAIARAHPARIEGRNVPVLAPEDLIVFKLVAGRARDYEAVAAIINARAARLDTDYITGWLEQFEVADRWARALDDASREAPD